jgi:hypothetical protein
MQPKILKVLIFSLMLAGGFASNTRKAAAQDRPPMFFREDWMETPPATPVTQEHVVNKDLLLSLHGPGKEGIRKSNHDQPADDPFYIWSGVAEGNWAVSLRHATSDVDLRGQSRIRWRSKQAGFRVLRPIIKLANGDWLVADGYDNASADWREREFVVADLTWRRLDIQKVIEGRRVNAPDLSRVVEIGFTDLMTGGGSDACSRLDWIEVWGKPVTRTN